MMSELRMGRRSGGVRLGHVGARLPRALQGRSRSRRRAELTLLYGKAFSRIRVGERKKTPALIQVDCRESDPHSAVQRIRRSCAGIGRGDLIELLTTDLTAVVAALSWCRAKGGRVERMESASGAYVLDIEPGDGETIPCAQFHAPSYDRSRPSRVTMAEGSGAGGHPTPHGSSNGVRGGWVEG